MKTAQNLVPKILLALFIFGLLTNCEPKGKDKPDKDQEEVPIVKRPRNIIDLREADIIYENYSEHRRDIIETYEREKRSPDEKFEAARFIDFDYETIKQYLDYIDQEAAKAGVSKVTKLRLYFANYPNDSTFVNKQETVNQARRNSIFMVPTLENQGIDYGFYIGENGKARLISDWKMEWKSEMKNGMGFQESEPNKAYAGFSLNSSLQGDGKSLTLNFGHGGPPPKSDF